jgi:indoleamine 2,3-dioxygenase
VLLLLPSFSYHFDRDMVAHSGKLVSAAEDALLAAVSKARDPFNDSLERLYEAYKTVCNMISRTENLTNFFLQINLSMDTMWGRSKPACALIPNYFSSVDLIVV